MTEEKPILTEKKDGVYKIILNRPSKLNSMTLEMLELIEESVDKASNDNSVRAILITGAGDRAFCAGADITKFQEMDGEGGRNVSKTGHRVFTKLLQTPKPVVAAVNGYALGGGCELACFCDIRLASEKARFSQPEVNVGLLPGWGGTYILPKLVGKTLAYEMITTGKRLNAEQALEAGLVNAVYPAEEFKEKVEEYMKTLVKGPPKAVASMKKLTHLDPSMETALQAEEDEFANLWNYQDLQEGLSAFMEKRKPEFKGE